MVPLLSIVIVFRNCESDLVHTLKSITVHNAALQSLPTEIVFIDGFSVDGSSKVAKNFRISSVIPSKLIRQIPKGIYPAMNLGAEKASGQWVLYINAGDILYDTSQLGSLIYQAKSQGLQAIQFNSAIRCRRGRLAAFNKSSNPRCHQALVYNKDLHNLIGKYEESFRVCSDSRFMSKIPRSLILESASILAVTQVSPNNASRTPALVSHDIQKLKLSNVGLSIWARPGLTLFTLKAEKKFGVSLSVLLKSFILLAIGKAALIRIEDSF